MTEENRKLLEELRNLSFECLSETNYTITSGACLFEGHYQHLNLENVQRQIDEREAFRKAFESLSHWDERVKRLKKEWDKVADQILPVLLSFNANHAGVKVPGPESTCNLAHQAARERLEWFCETAFTRPVPLKANIGVCKRRDYIWSELSDSIDISVDRRWLESFDQFCKSQVICDDFYNRIELEYARTLGDSVPIEKPVEESVVWTDWKSPSDWRMWINEQLGEFDYEGKVVPMPKTSWKRFRKSIPFETHPQKGNKLIRFNKSRLQESVNVH